MNECCSMYHIKLQMALFVEVKGRQRSLHR